jgi:hypothetical protein
MALRASAHWRSSAISVPVRIACVCACACVWLAMPVPVLMPVPVPPYLPVCAAMLCHWWSYCVSVSMFVSVPVPVPVPVPSPCYACATMPVLTIRCDGIIGFHEGFQKIKDVIAPYASVTRKNQITDASNYSTYWTGCAHLHFILWEAPLVISKQVREKLKSLSSRKSLWNELNEHGFCTHRRTSIATMCERIKNSFFCFLMI